jgi:cleavage and polyadenylation specificity factor subunit 1
MFSLVRTPHPATGVEHSIQARFFGPGETNLIVAGTNNLRVFRLVPDFESQNVGQDSPKMKLECMATYT